MKKAEMISRWNNIAGSEWFKPVTWFVAGVLVGAMVF